MESPTVPSQRSALAWWRWARWITLGLVILTTVLRRLEIDPLIAWACTILFFIVLGYVFTIRLRFSLSSTAIHGFLLGATIGLGSALLTFLIEWQFHLFFALVTDTIIAGLVGLLITSATAIFLETSPRNIHP